jgi:hypothetical protein
VTCLKDARGQGKTHPPGANPTNLDWSRTRHLRPYPETFCQPQRNRLRYKTIIGSLYPGRQLFGQDFVKVGSGTKGA